MVEAQSYRHGRILWAYLRSNQTGKREMHPAIILDRTEAIVQPEDFDPRKAAADNLIHVVGVSTKYKACHLMSISLPHTPSGHVLTRLKEDCGAVIGWYDRLTIPDDIVGFGGDVPSPVMARIDEAVRHDLARRLGKQFETMGRMLDELLDESK